MKMRQNKKSTQSHSFRETNFVHWLIYELQIKSKTV